jgi:glutamate racemase
MGPIAVFDSGLGSLSIIKEIQKICKCNIIYLADHKNFPYGLKTKQQLEKIIKQTITLMNEKFNPELIVVASNTPTILLELNHRKIIGVKPPIKKAIKISKTKQIAILGTKSLIKSKMLTDYVYTQSSSDVTVHKINGSPLVELVESGKFMKNKKYCIKIIKNHLENMLDENNIDVCILSSTHLPFLRTLLEFNFPNVIFIDPGKDVATKVCKLSKNKPSQNKLKIYSTENSKIFQKTLNQLGINHKINSLK